MAREEFAEHLRLQDDGHLNEFNQIQAWIAEKEEYLKTREDINDTAAASVIIILP